MDQSNTFASKTKISIFLKMNEKALDEMKNSTKVSDRLTDNPQDNTYIHCLSLPQTRIRYRQEKGIDPVQSQVSKQTSNNHMEI